MILIFLCFSTTLSLVQIKNLLPEYILAQDEQVFLELNTYFSGDSLQYQITPNSSAILINSFSNQTRRRVHFKFNTTKPVSINNMLPLLPKTHFNQLILYGTSDELILFYINFELLRCYEIKALNFQPFSQFQPISPIPIKKVIFLTQDYKLYYLTIEYIFEFVPELSNLTQLILQLPSEQVYMSEGYIVNYLLLTGYDNSEAFAYFYNIANITDPKFVQKIKIANESPLGSIPLLAATVGDDHYVICTSESKLIKFSITFYGMIQIEDVLVLDVFAENITSIQPSLYENNLLIGIKGGFMVVSFDFQQVYIKTKPLFSDSVYVGNSGTYNVIFTGNGTDYWLFELSDRYDIIQSTSFHIDEEKFMWGIFSFAYPHDVFIYGVEGGIMIVNFTFLEPLLIINSSEKIVNFNLLASQTYPNLSLSQSFAVKRPKNNQPGYIERVGSPSVTLSFKEFKSFVSISLYDYIVGSNITAKVLNISIPTQENDYFSFSLNHTDNFVQSSSVLIESGNYNSILVSDIFVIVYNSTGFSAYYDSEMDFSYNLESSTIKNILYCYTSYVVYYQSNLNLSYYLHIAVSNNLANNFVIDLVSECLTLECSPIFLICQNSSGVQVVEILKNLKFNSRFINNQNLTMPITSLSIAFFNYMVVVSNYTSFMIIDLEALYFLFNLNVIVNQTSNFKITKTLSNAGYMYLLSDHGLVYMYDNSLNFLKRFSVLNTQNLQVHGTYLISIDNNSLQIIDTIQFVTNSTIAIRNIENCISFTGKIYKSQLTVYFLYDNNIDVYQVPEYYNHLNLSVEIKNFNDIDYIEYQAELKVLVFNSISQNILDINLTLYVNGETIYKNFTGIEYLQKHNMNLQCGDVSIIPMNEIFVGQGLSGQVLHTKLASLNKRIEPRSGNFTLNAYKVYIYSSNFQVYIANFECSIYLLDISFEPKFIYSFNESTKECYCYSGEILTDLNFIAFVMGCTIKDNRLNDVDSLHDYENILLFGIFKDEDLVSLSNFSIIYSPQKLRVSSKVSGEFLLAFSEDYEVTSSNSFYSNHLTLIQGYLIDTNFKINQVFCDYSILFSLNNYYLTDFQLFNDPLFNVYYIYTLDYYFGLRIFSLVNDDTCEARTTISFPSPAYSVKICGGIMYIVMQDTQIAQYLMKNWVQPVFPSIIPAYSSTYETVQGSLTCSSKIFSQYIIYQMKTYTEDYYLHIVDTLAKNMSNTVTDYLIATFLNGQPVVYTEFLNNSGYFIVINESNWQIFLINPFQLVIDTNDYCSKGLEQNFTIVVNNILNRNNSAQLRIKINEYRQGHVDYGKIELWQLSLICIAAFILSLLLYLIIHRKCLKHKSRVEVNALFSSSQNFTEISSNFLSPKIKVNESSTEFE